MSIPDELLMAYADGELNGAERAADRAKVEAAMKADPALARRVEEHKAMRARLKAHFDPALDEPVPDRLIAAARGVRKDTAASWRAGSAERSGHDTPPEGSASAPLRSAATVTDLARARAARHSAARAQRGTPPWSWAQWGAIAASLIIGVILGHLALQEPETGPVVSHDGRLVAQAGLAEALSNQLASTQSPAAPVQIGTSFKAKSGAYCRTFVLHDGHAMGGLACRAGDTWDVHTLARTESTPGPDGGYRQAGSEMPPAVRTAVESEIVGEPLDSGGEEQAKRDHWQ